MVEETANVPQSAPPIAPVSSPVPDADEKFFAALGYFGFLFVVTLIAKPKSAYCKFHARQSMVLFLAFFVSMILLLAIRWFGSIAMLILFAVYVLAIYRAYSGEMWKIPVISSFAGHMNVESLYGATGKAIKGLSDLKQAAADAAQKAGESAQKTGKNPPD